MSGLAHRMGELFPIRANKALERAEEPREVLNHSYEQQPTMFAFGTALPDETLAPSGPVLPDQDTESRQVWEPLPDQGLILG